jgi:hypothetical protein
MIPPPDRPARALRKEKHRWTLDGARGAPSCRSSQPASPPSQPASRAADCLAPLAENDKWTCTEELESGETVSYCLNVTGFSGAGVSRTFGIKVPFNEPRTCTCGGKGKGAGARFTATSAYFCFDASRDLAETGTITRKKITGQIFVASESVRRALTCRPDPACVVVE